MLIFFGLEALRQGVWYDLLDSYPILSCERVILAIPVVIDVVRPHKSSNLGILV